MIESVEFMKYMTTASAKYSYLARVNSTSAAEMQSPFTLVDRPVAVSSDNVDFSVTPNSADISLVYFTVNVF